MRDENFRGSTHPGLSAGILRTLARDSGTVREPSKDASEIVSNEFAGLDRARW
jgi:hypothetical protein